MFILLEDLFKEVFVGIFELLGGAGGVRILDILDAHGAALLSVLLTEASDLVVDDGGKDTEDRSQDHELHVAEKIAAANLVVIGERFIFIIEVRSWLN